MPYLSNLVEAAVLTIPCLQRELYRFVFVPANQVCLTVRFCEMKFEACEESNTYVCVYVSGY